MAQNPSLPSHLSGLPPLPPMNVYSRLLPVMYLAFWLHKANMGALNCTLYPLYPAELCKGKEQAGLFDLTINSF